MIIHHHTEKHTTHLVHHHSQHSKRGLFFMSQTKCFEEKRQEANLLGDDLIAVEKKREFLSDLKFFCTRA
ncbi:hypothetical protein CUMW_113600 [Citrus unshiu]|nr:hypothetical protein CUMW_113600 [Citrus unshiu]